MYLGHFLVPVRQQTTMAKYNEEGYYFHLYLAWELVVISSCFNKIKVKLLICFSSVTSNVLFFPLLETAAVSSHFKNVLLLNQSGINLSPEQERVGGGEVINQSTPVSSNIQHGGQEEQEVRVETERHD